MFLARLFLVISLHSSTRALRCSRYRERTIMTVAMNNKCYYAWPRKRGTYNEAVKLCQKGGTHVLFTETKEEHHRLISRLGPSFTRIWIGLERNDSEWRWQGGQRSRPVEKLLFADKLASSTGHNAIVSKSNGKYIWQVQDPKNTFQIVCEHEQDRNTADRVLRESSSDDRYGSSSWVLANTGLTDNAISRETEGSWVTTSMSSQFVVGLSTPRVQSSLIEPFVMTTGKSLRSEETKSTMTLETQMHSEIPDSRFEVNKDLSTIPVQSGVNVGTSATFNEELTVMTYAAISRWVDGSKLEQSNVHGQSINLVASTNLGTEPVYSITPGQFRTPDRSIKPEQTITMELTFTPEQNSNLWDSSFPGQVVHPGKTITPEKTFTPKQSIRIRDSSLKNIYITSEQSFDQGGPTYHGDSIYKVHAQKTSIRQQNNAVMQDSLEEATQESTPMADQASVSSSEIVSVGFSATTTVPTPASTTLREGPYPGAELLPSVNGLNSSVIPSQIHSVRQTMWDTTSSLPATETNNPLSSPIHSKNNARQNNTDPFARSIFSTAAFGPQLITPTSSVISSIESFEISPQSVLVESSIKELPIDGESGSHRHLTLGLSSGIGSFASSKTGSAASWVVVRTPSRGTGSTTTADTESSASVVLSSSNPVVIRLTATGAAATFSPSDIRSSTLDIIWSSTSDVIVASASDLTELFGSGMAESSVSGMIVSTASGVIRSFSSGVIGSAASGVTRPFTSGLIKPSFLSLSRELSLSAPLVSDVIEPYASSAVGRSGEIGSSSAGEIGSSASGEIWSSASGEIGSSSAGEIGSSASGEIWSSASGEIGSSSAGESGSSSAGEIGSSASGEIGSSASGESGSSSAGEIGSSASGEIRSSASGEIGSSASGEIRSSSVGEIGSSASGEIWSSASGEIGSSAGEIGSSALGEIGSSASGGIGSSASGEIGSSSAGEMWSSASGEIGSADAGPVSLRPLSSATLEESANVIRIVSSFSSLSSAPAVLTRNKSDSTGSSVGFRQIPFSSSDSSLKPASLSLDTSSSSKQELAVAETDTVQVIVSTPTSKRVSKSVTTTVPFDDWTDISASSEPVLDSGLTISVTMSTTTYVAGATVSAVLVGLSALPQDITTSTLSSPTDTGRVQNKVPEYLEAGYYVVAYSSDHRNNIETFAFRKVTSITDVTMTTTFPATSTINCARVCASGQYECNIVVLKGGICRLYFL